MRRDYAGFLEFFFGEMFPEPHSTKQIEDAVAFGLDDHARAMLMDEADAGRLDEARRSSETVRRVRCPMLVVHGDLDELPAVRRSGSRWPS